MHGEVGGEVEGCEGRCEEMKRQVEEVNNRTDATIRLYQLREACQDVGYKVKHKRWEVEIERKEGEIRELKELNRDEARTFPDDAENSSQQSTVHSQQKQRADTPTKPNRQSPCIERGGSERRWSGTEVGGELRGSIYLDTMY